MNSLYNMLFMMFIILLIILIALIVYYFMMKNKEKQEEQVKTKSVDPITGEEKAATTSTSSSTLKTTTYAKHSVFDFMEFDDVQDNMIIQKNEKRFLMVVECQGVNYDLMSRNEKIAVEEGFLQFLNTLRHSIQIYIQTRAVNLTESIENYKKRVDEIGRQLELKEYQLKSKRESGMYDQEELDRDAFEVLKERNLYTYGKDIIFNTEQMSLNKNILTKRYYVIVAYSTSELGANNVFGKDEIRNIAFSELYTKARSMMGTLAACDIKTKVLNSSELVELLYSAYNRDEAEVFSSDKAMMAGYNDLYVTSQDVVVKKMKELDKKIEEKAIETANRAILVAKSELEKKYDKKNKSLEDLIEESALRILEENKTFVGPKTAEVAQEKIRQQSKARKEKIEEEKIKKEAGKDEREKAKRRTRKS